MVESEQDVGFDELSLDGGRADGHDGFTREDDRAFGNRPDIAGELEIREEREEFFAENLLRAQVFDVGGCEVQILNVADDLLKTRGDGITASVRDTSEEHVKIRDPVPQLGLEISAAHGQFVEVAQQGKAVFVVFHGKVGPP